LFCFQTINRLLEREGNHTKINREFIDLVVRGSEIGQRNTEPRIQYVVPGFGKSTASFSESDESRNDNILRKDSTTAVNPAPILAVDGKISLTISSSEPRNSVYSQPADFDVAPMSALKERLNNLGVAVRQRFHADMVNSWRVFRSPLTAYSICHDAMQYNRIR